MSILIKPTCHPDPCVVGVGYSQSDLAVELIYVGTPLPWTGIEFNFCPFCGSKLPKLENQDGNTQGNL